jgi:diketogulonate reductase-like aldo/keto reductase
MCRCSKVCTRNWLSTYRYSQYVFKAINESGIPRKELFVTTKVWNSDQGYKNTLAAFDRSQEKLKIGYIDLYLIHWPMAGLINETWRALEELYGLKKVRAIGVSNFQINHLKELMEHSEIRPMVNQLEIHPFIRQKEVVDFCKVENIQLVAWSPIMRGKVSEVPEIQTMARKYNRTAAQITLRWHIQNGIVPIPKSSNRERIFSNLQIFDFKLTSEEMQIIESLKGFYRNNE